MDIKRNIKLIAWLNFFTDFIFFAPVAIIYFSKISGSAALGMSVFSVAYISSAAFEVPTGVFSDIIGRKRTAILGALTALICLILYALASSYILLFIGALFQGLSRAFYSGNNDALLHDTLTQIGKEKEYHSYLGRTSSMFQVALALAAFTGSIMASHSFSLVMWASVVPQIFTFFISLNLIEPAVVSSESTNIFEHLGESVKQFNKNTKLRLLTSASVLRFSLGESIFFLRPIFVNMLWPLWAVGIANMLSNIFGALSFYFSGKVIKRFSFLKVLRFEVIYGRLVSFIALIFPTIASPVLMSSSSLTFGTGNVATNALLQKEFTQKQRATMGSLNSLAGSIFFGICAVILGAISDYWGVVVALIIANLFLFILIFVYKKLAVIDDKVLRSVGNTATN